MEAEIASYNDAFAFEQPSDDLAFCFLDALLTVLIELPPKYVHRSSITTVLISFRRIPTTFACSFDPVSAVKGRMICTWK